MVFTCVQPAFAALGSVTKLSAKNVTSESVTLSWNKVSGADGYRVYRYSYDNRKWSAVKKTTAVSFTDKAMKPGKRYAYRVRAYETTNYKTVYGSYSSNVYVNVPPEKVNGVGTYDVTSDSITLKWNKAEGATGYIVYMYNSSTGKYIRLGVTAKNSYKAEKVKSVVGARFRVRSYTKINKTYVYGEYSDLYTNKIALSNIRNAKVSSVKANSYKISWSAVKGAEAYQVVRYDAVNKKWKYIKKVTSASAAFKGIDEGEKAVYRVRAYAQQNGKNVYGNYSSNINATTLPAMPNNLKVSANKYNGLTIKWNEVKGATGYVIYSYNSANGKWVLLGTTTKNYYYNNKLTETRNYTYRVKAFISLDGNTYYGPECPSVSEFYTVKKQDNETIAKLEKEGIFGYLYDPAENCFYTSADPWQRNVGYNKIFDLCAPFTLINFDTERIYFKYKNKDWLVQLWKGQYGLVFYGAEIGVYYKPSDRELAHYDSVSDEDMLKMSVDFYVKSSSGKWNKKFTRPYGEYWWCTGFLAGNIGNNFDRLRYILRITMKDAEMFTAFEKALKETGLSYKVDGLDIYIDYK